MYNDYNLLGVPTLSREGFRIILVNAGAPTAVINIASALYDICLNTSVDPNVALVFGQVEHSLRWLGVAGSTKGWGNLRPGSSWTGEVYSADSGRKYSNVGSAEAAKDSGNLFRVYGTYEAGLQDFCRLMNYYTNVFKLPTVRQAVPVYAPKEDNNDTTAYITNAINYLNTWNARYGNEMIEIVKAGFTATVKDTGSLNVRTGPGVAYALASQLAAKAGFTCVGYTTNGVPYTYNGVTSATWLQLDSNLWVTGHEALVTYSLPPDVPTLQNSISTLQSNLSTVQGQLATANDRINALSAANSTLTNWKNAAMTNVNAARNSLAKVQP